MSSNLDGTKRTPLIIQFVGYKHTGKTTWVCRLTELFKQAGYRVGTVKHDAHDFHMDQPGTDTWRHQTSGADITAISSSSRTAILKQGGESLEQLIAAIQYDVDLILIEGFKNACYPKIILARESAHLSLLEELNSPIALVIWPKVHAPQQSVNRIPVFAIDEYNAIFQLLHAQLKR